MKKLLSRPALGLCLGTAALVGGLAWGIRPAALEASSHREAPMIADDPLADNTDVYAFVAPNDPNRVVLIADYIPFQLPQGGPNYSTFGENIRYEIHVKNNSTTSGDDITYRFVFTRTSAAPTGDPTTFFNVRLGKQNLKTTYTCAKSIAGGPFVNIVTNGVVPVNNIGPRSISSGAGLNQPSYTNLRQSAVANATGGAGEQVFCGPSDEPFFIDLGATFDLAGFRVNQGHRDGLAHYNVHSIALTIPIASLQKNGQGLPAAGGIDWASLVGAFLVQLAQLLILWLLGGMGPGVVWLIWLAVFGVARVAVSGLMGLLIVYAVLSWVQARSLIGDVVARLCEPLLRPIRRVVPLLGGVDLSPLVALILLQVLTIVLGHIQGAVMF